MKEEMAVCHCCKKKERQCIGRAVPINWFNVYVVGWNRKTEIVKIIDLCGKCFKSKMNYVNRRVKNRAHNRCILKKLYIYTLYLTVTVEPKAERFINSILP